MIEIHENIDNVHDNYNNSTKMLIDSTNTLIAMMKYNHKVIFKAN